MGYPTLPYPTELKWKVGVKCVCVGGGVGLVTLPHPILFYGVHVGYKTDQEMKCGGGGGVGVNIGWGTLPWGDRSEHWVVTLPYPTVPVFSLGIF